MKNMLLLASAALLLAVTTPVTTTAQTLEAPEIVADTISFDGAQANFGASWWWADEDYPGTPVKTPWHYGLHLPGLGY